MKYHKKKQKKKKENNERKLMYINISGFHIFTTTSIVFIAMRTFKHTFHSN